VDQQNIKIAISGDLGSGKSTICRLLQEQLSYRVFSMGEAWRKLAEKYQMTILELNQYSETHSLDEEMDQTMAAMADDPENIIFDSRLAWHFIPQSFKVHLTVNSRIAAERIYHDQRGEAEGYSSVEEARQKLEQRKLSEHQRYLAKYRIDCSRFENYDLVIDTSYALPAEIAALITKELKKWLNREAIHKLWLAPKNLYPTHNISTMQREELPQLIQFMKTNGYPEGTPVSIIQAGCQFFIMNGHNRVSAAISAGLTLIPVENITDQQSHISICLPVKNMELLRQWEDFLDFRFTEYPS
jgi:cytidylate kinase